MAHMANDSQALVGEDLKSIINTAIAKTSAFETDIDIRAAAIETLQQICNVWEKQISRSDGTPCAQDENIDRLHLAYTAAQKLIQYRNYSDDLSTNIVARLARHVQEGAISTTGELREILQCSAEVRTEQMEKMREEKEALARRREQAEEGIIDAVAGRHEVEIPADLTASSKLQESSSKGKGPVSTGDAYSLLSGNAIEGLVPREKRDHQVPTTPAGAAAPLQSSATLQSPMGKGIQKGRPGNFTKEKGMTWYPDEDQFMYDLIGANPKWTYKQYAEANATEFKGTYYTDKEGKQHPGMRDVRTTNAVRLRFARFKLDRARQIAGQALEEDGDRVETVGTDAGIAFAGGGDDLVATVAPAYEKRMSGADETMSGLTAEGALESAAVVIYASGKITYVEDRFSAAPEVDDEPHSEVGDDENPLEDLEDMVEVEMTDTV